MKTGFNISFFGSSLVSAYWNGAATYYRGILKYLHDAGHNITFFEPDAFDRQKNRDIADPDYAKIVVYSADDEKSVLNTVTLASDSDIVIKASGVGVYDSLLEKAVLDLKTTTKAVIFWDVDAPATLERIENDRSDPFRELIPQYDLILTYGGGDAVVNGYLSNGAVKCVPVYNALDPTTHFRVATDDRFRGTLNLLANRMPDREQRIWEFFFKPAGMLPQMSFNIGGSGWDQNIPDYKNLRNLGHVSTNEHNAFNSSPLAVLNINRDSMVRYGYSPATRIFEAAGAGACIITDNWKGIEMFLEPDKECLVANNGDEVAEILEDLTADRAFSIGQAAMKRILNKHTYYHRVIELEKVLNGIPKLKREVII